MEISVIVTVYNEEDTIQQLLSSLAAQSRLPDEIVICDGGSGDGTVKQIQQFDALSDRLRLLVEPGANISRGRNVAIAAATGPIIAVTDAGVELAPHWLEKLVEPLEPLFDVASGFLDAPGVAGFFLPAANGVFQVALAATTLPLPGEIDPRRFLPSSRSVAFTKRAWAAAGGYPEWLDYGEDLVFDLTLAEQSAGDNRSFLWVPDALVYFRPRTSLAAFWRQYYLYARGDGKAQLWPKRHLARYGTYLLLIPGLIGHGYRGRFARWLGWLGLGAGVALHCARPWQRLRRLGTSLRPGQKLLAAALVPLLRAVGDLAKMAGYPSGLLWRWSNRSRPEIYWRERI